MILAIDQGTTGSTAILFDEDARPLGRGYREIKQHYPRPGWVEHDPRELVESALHAARDALRAAGVEGRQLRAIGITNQRETVVAWDVRSGEPLAPAIVWQDRRTADRCQELREHGREPFLRERTGLLLDPYFSATKIQWLLLNEPAVAEAGPRARFGTVDSWLCFQLCGRHATDASNASRTLLFDLAALAFDEDLCALFEVPRSALPEVLPSAAVYGETEVFGGRVPVAGIAGDQQAALFGQACLASGELKNTYGTGSFVLENVGERLPPPAHGLVTTIAWLLDDRPTYALEASIFVTGAAVQWLRDGLGLIADAAETEALAASLPDNEGVYFVPALTGLGSPHWDPHARGTIVGLTRGTGRAHLARAALEAIAYQSADAVATMRARTGLEPQFLRADGGATVNRFLMQFQADVLGIPVAVPEVNETTALGAALLAGVGAGLWSSEDVRDRWRERVRYEPRISDTEREYLLEGWRRALQATRAASSLSPTAAAADAAAHRHLDTTPNRPK
ncbi:glycerol kinase GlpK [Thermoleophilum album]|uniref:glycerol kinase n=1 Tax=Thermoleophilum album TaxID=29539 RepID=A0A1H6FME2_THEAL|nr:glycerol kinase GlpK [Thermoleophilum album]SEH12026.1 glycerol kinase [Thermoleophilum album]